MVHQGAREPVQGGFVVLLDFLARSLVAMCCATAKGTHLSHVGVVGSYTEYNLVVLGGDGRCVVCGCVSYALLLQRCAVISAYDARCCD